MVGGKPAFLSIDTIKAAKGNPELINALVRMTGISLSALSKKHNLGPSTLTQAVHALTCPTGERVILSHLQTFEIYQDLTGHDLWPERYDPKGNRLIGWDAKLAGSHLKS